jgi:polyhydroxyalkanoate synthase
LTAIEGGTYNSPVAGTEPLVFPLIFFFADLARRSRWIASVALSWLLLAAAALFAAPDAPVSREHQWIVTKKKFELHAERLRPAGQRGSRAGLLLLHGLFLGSAFLNLDEEHSLARYLALQGFDVWNVSLRGSGRSLLPLKEPPPSWTLDSIIEEDLPDALRQIQAQTPGAAVGCVGYELGGVLLLGYAARRLKPGCSVLVAVASPLTFHHPEQEPLRKLLPLKESRWRRQIVLYLNAPFLARLFLSVSPAMQRIFYEPDNLDEGVREKVLTEALIAVNPGVLDHLLVVIDRREFVSHDGGFNYRRHLSRAQLPVLLIGGEKDPLAPAASLKEIYRTLGSRDKTARVFGSKSGGYGHLDLIVGKRAKEEIFSPIGKWLRERLR